MNFFQISNIQNLDLLFVGITIAAIAILGVTTFLNKRGSITHKTFLLFSFFTIAYGTANYIAYQITSLNLILWALRFTIFFATWHAFSFFQFTYVFPEEKKRFPRKYKFILLPIVVVTSLLTLTPLVFSGIEVAGTSGQASQATHRPGIAIFALLAIFLVLASIFVLVRKTLKAKGREKQQLQLISAGTLITFIFLILFNLILPAGFNNVSLLPLAPIFFLPFILLTAYAIIRYQFLNIKVIATEILTFILAMVTLFEVLFANVLTVLLFRVAIFLAVLGFGILLVRSVRREVEQREQMEKLTKDLASANQELKRLDAAKSEFVSIASHQLRTPLTAMKGYLSLIREGAYGKVVQKFQRPLANVYASNERLIRLVNDLLSLSRIESGKMKIEPEPTNVAQVIQSVIDELKLKAQQKNLELVFQEPPAPLPAIMADPEKIRNVILNLIDNSIRYTKQGSITASYTTKGNKLSITIQDTGEGMTQEEIGKLFESFSRGQAGKELSTEGTGLGLYIAKQFVEMHKGKIWAESAGKGQGSTFFVELPLDKM